MLWLRPLRDPAAQGAEHEIPPVFPNAQGREAFLREPPTMYNNHEELTDSRKEGVYHMVKNSTRKNTTFEERIKIVEECIGVGCDYTSIAKKYACSYGQVYSWVKKYQDKGIEGLYDRRGKNKPIDELSEIEKLKIENRLLKAESKQQKMEIDFLKKLEEIERR